MTGGDRAEIALRYSDIPEPAVCARRHWEARSELTCRKGHALLKVTDAMQSTCFACNDRDCSNGYYWCVQCSAFQACADCMVHAAQPEPAPAEPEPAPPVAKKVRTTSKIPRHIVEASQQRVRVKEETIDSTASAASDVGASVGVVASASAALAVSDAGANTGDVVIASASSAASASTSPPQPLPRLLVVLHGHICRHGGRLTSNFDGDVSVHKEVLRGLSQVLSTLVIAGFAVLLVVDVVAVEATEEQRTQMANLIHDYAPKVAHMRTSVQNLGPAQTDSLLVTNRWLKKSLCGLAHFIGIFYFRADLLFKKKFSAPDWVLRGLL